MKTNMLRAVITLAKARNNSIMDIYRSNTRINNVGDALEYYIKDMYCGTLKSNMAAKESAYSSAFSYLGNQNNPPDFIIKQGDAVEVKKVGGIRSNIALNSSYPKSKLFSSDNMLTDACRSCEEWQEKDYIYTIGTVAEKKLKLLWMVYGDCYAADKSVYERIKKAVKNGVKGIKGVEWAQTRELGKVKKVDPLGITDLRVRGMWHIENPIKVFSSHIGGSLDSDFSLIAIIRQSKYKSFPSEDRAQIESGSIKNLSASDIDIKDPDNPAKQISAKLIKFSF